MNKPYAVKKHVSTAGKKAAEAMNEAQQAVGMLTAASITNADAKANNALSKEADFYLEDAERILTEALESLRKARKTLNG
mgnify:CR=1 FL=1